MSEGWESVVPAEQFPDLHAAVRSVVCPRCGAAEGRGCRSSRGVQAVHHAARWAEARRIGAVIDLE